MSEILKPWNTPLNGSSITRKGFSDTFLHNFLGPIAKWTKASGCNPLITGSNPVGVSTLKNCKEGTPIVNLCKSGLMSECVGETEEEQKTCAYYEKATSAKRCMYRKYDNFCDCLPAQLDARKSLQEKNQEIINERKEDE